MVGVVQVTNEDSSWGDQLGFADDGPAGDGAVDAAGGLVAGALDAYLDSAQAGSPDLLLLRGLWLDGADPDAAAVLRTGITNPDNPVRTATYDLVVHLEPDPTLVTAAVQVARSDETTVRLEMVFDVSSGEPVLHLVGAPEVA